MYGGRMNSAISQYNQVRVESSVFDVDAHRLVAMLLDGAVEKLVAARLHMANGNVAEKGRCIGGGSAIILSLRDSLDMNQGGDIARNLDALYTYMSERLVDANIANDLSRLDEVINLLKPIRDGWNEIPMEARSEHAAQRRAIAS